MPGKYTHHPYRGFMCFDLVRESLPLVSCVQIFHLFPNLQQADGHHLGSGLFVVTSLAESSSAKEEQAYFTLKFQLQYI